MQTLKCIVLFALRKSVVVVVKVDEKKHLNSILMNSSVSAKKCYNNCCGMLRLGWLVIFKKCVCFNRMLRNSTTMRYKPISKCTSFYWDLHQKNGSDNAPFGGTEDSGNFHILFFWHFKTELSYLASTDLLCESEREKKNVFLILRLDSGNCLSLSLTLSLSLSLSHTHTHTWPTAYHRAVFCDDGYTHLCTTSGFVFLNNQRRYSTVWLQRAGTSI